jgi:F-type H+-transporting ATPase subunit c
MLTTKKGSLEDTRMKTVGKTLVGIGAALFTMLVTAAAYAQEAAGPTAFNDRDKWIAAASAIGVGIAAFGGALGQGRAAASALEGIARNPGASDKLFTPMIIGLALIESLVIYSLVVFFSLLGKIH